MLRLTAVAYLVAALAELFRYILLVRNQDVLLSRLVVAVSDTLVWVFSVLAIVAAVVSAVAAACWLVEERQRRFGRLLVAETRSPQYLLLGCLTPIASLVMPGVFLRELIAPAGARPDDRPAEDLAWRWAAAWWVAWVLSWILQASSMMWRDASSLQAQADSVLFAAFTDAFAAGVAVLTLVVMREVARLGEEVTSSAKRLVVAVPS